MIGSAKRILILGWPGSGKSTLARKLSRESGIPHIEVDTFLWVDRKGGATRAGFIDGLRAELEKDAWIVEGHYRKIESFLPRPDLILILEPSFTRLLGRLFARDLREFLVRRRETSDLIWVLKNQRSLPRFNVDELKAKWACDVQILRS